MKALCFGELKCEQCKQLMPEIGVRRTCIRFRASGIVGEHSLYFGDYIEKGLQSIGITQDRYKHLKEAVGLPPTCNCTGRKERLNEWHKEVESWLAKAKQWWYSANPNDGA